MIVAEAEAVACMAIILRRRKMVKVEEKKINLQCIECGKRFSRKLGPTSTREVKCPKCGSVDIDIA